MNKDDVKVIRKYLSETGIKIDLQNYTPNSKAIPRQVLRTLLESNEHALVKTEIVDVDVESGNSIPNVFLALYQEKIHLIRRIGVNRYVVDGQEGGIPFQSCDCFAVRVSFRYADATLMASVFLKRTPKVSLLFLTLVFFVMASPVYSNLFNSRLVFGESVSSLLVVSAIFIVVFLAEYFLKEWIMGGVNRQIERETLIAEDVLFHKVVDSRNKDSIVHWKTATESIVQIWRSAGNIGLDALTVIVIMVAFMFMLGIYSIFPIVGYTLFFVLQLSMKMKAYRKILMLNQLRDQKLTYLIGMDRAKKFFKFLSGDRIRRRWMGMTEEVSAFNIQIQDHEEKAAGVLKFYSSSAIVIIFVAAYFAIQEGLMEQAAVIALMLLNGRCTGAISALSTRLYQASIAKSKMTSAISIMHEESSSTWFDVGVAYVPKRENAVVAKDLAMAYGEQDIFRGVDISISSGMTMAVIGEAGSGKSTLLRVLAGYEPPTRGSVHLNNVSPCDYDSEFFKEYVAYYSPEDKFIGDTLAFNSALKYGIDQRTFGHAYEFFGAKFVLNQNSMHGELVDELNLSSGQYQLVKMIASLGKRPDLIVLDEPCSNLSPVEATRFMSRLREKFPRAIIIFSSHSMMLTKQANLILDMKTKEVKVNKSSK